jgi:hypothetical protein
VLKCFLIWKHTHASNDSRDPFRVNDLGGDVLLADRHVTQDLESVKLNADILSEARQCCNDYVDSTEQGHFFPAPIGVDEEQVRKIVGMPWT